MNKNEIISSHLKIIDILDFQYFFHIFRYTAIPPMPVMVVCGRDTNRIWSLASNCVYVLEEIVYTSLIHYWFNIELGMVLV